MQDEALVNSPRHLGILYHFLNISINNLLIVCPISLVPVLGWKCIAFHGISVGFSYRKFIHNNLLQPTHDFNDAFSHLILYPRVSELWGRCDFLCSWWIRPKNNNWDNRQKPSKLNLVYSILCSEEAQQGLNIEKTRSYFDSIFEDELLTCPLERTILSLNKRNPVLQGTLSSPSFSLFPDTRSVCPLALSILFSQGWLVPPP